MKVVYHCYVVKLYVAFLQWNVIKIWKYLFQLYIKNYIFFTKKCNKYTNKQKKYKILKYPIESHLMWLVDLIEIGIFNMDLSMLQIL